MENSIERNIEIKAPISKVWKALTDSKSFEKWFKVKLEGPFVAGQTTQGMNEHPGYEFAMKFFVKEIKPETYFSYAWHPFPTDKTFDYSKEDPTLVEFTLKETTAGTLLTVKESGFNRITASRRAEAFKMHTGGWEHQLQNIASFVG